MGDETHEDCEARRHKDNVGFLSGHALAGILAHSGPVFSNLAFDQVVNLAAKYGEALAKRLDTPSQT